MARMSIRTQKDFLAHLGLPYGTWLARRRSWKLFQEASTWHHYDPAAKRVGPLKVDGVCGDATTAHANAARRHGYRISPNFALAEFRCGCGGKERGCQIMRVHRSLVRMLEGVREDLYPKGLTIVSGYRCPRQNRKVGGVVGSCHLTGKAADIPAKYPAAKFLRRGFHGIEVRRHSGLVTHVDICAAGKDLVFYG